METHAHQATPDRWKTLGPLGVGLPLGGRLRPAEAGLRVGRHGRAGVVSHLGPFRPRRGRVRVGRAGAVPACQPIAVPTREPPGPPWWASHRAPAGAAPRRSPRRGAAPARPRSISSAAEQPFIASSAPPGATSGRPQRSSFGSGASARAVTTSNRSGRVQSSARPRTTSTPRDPAGRRPPRGTPSAAPSARSGSPARPGGRSPAPAPAGPPRSRGRPRRRPPAASGASRAQLTRCRSHSRGTSRGPISPRRTPSEASSAAYSSSRARRWSGDAEP